MLTRRSWLTGASALAAASLTPNWAYGARALTQRAPDALTGTQFNLDIARTPFRVDGRRDSALTVNGTVPAPLLRWREGDEVTLNVTNHLDVDSSIHWHGILLPFQMDGVPGVSFPGIRPGETFTYRFRLRQSGTYWYHSHSGLQEQEGLYGPIIVDPAHHDPVVYDREHVLVLSDWTFMSPEALFNQLKTNPESLNYNHRTLGDLVRDMGEDGARAALSDRAMWGQMRMKPTDISDVGGETYTYLINGQGPGSNWTGLFEPGERVRLRIINASAMTIFNLRIPGLPLQVVQADGQNVAPVETDELQIGVAETYDVVVTPREDRAFTIMAESIERLGYARATLAPREGMTAPVPELRPTPLLTMRDMGMDHGAMGHGGMDHGSMAQGQMDHGSMDHGSMDHSGHSGHSGAMQDDAPVTHNHSEGPGVANLNMAPISRLDEPGIGLEDVNHRVLTYSQLRSLDRNPDVRAPGREMQIHLTSNMERYMWSFDGVRFTEIDAPIVFHEGERLRVTLVNDTMMPHPIHLHGMFFELVNGGGDHKPRKHTVIVKPGERLAFDVTADEPGDWAFHCHLLYHMHAGMMQVVSVRPGPMDHSAHSGHQGHEGHHQPEPAPMDHSSHSNHSGHGGGHHGHHAPAPEPEPAPAHHNHHSGHHGGGAS
ncbi:copper resistance system multicopper oxidase [Oceanicaulis alexandrii]|uniref:copper resistance system multicopper oxidase n=1 Tax=Oceanicaulis alexandrii TaxID=153233 RepID=UPI0003B5ED50|nr:copper resistance system multicopper oxidase [Oceanicaulis alexandrii]